MSNSNEFQEHRRYVDKHVTTESKLMILAEECNELAKAALKYARALGFHADNPTPMTSADALLNLVEEAEDVLICLDIISVTRTVDTSYNSKWKRWAERLGYKEK